MENTIENKMKFFAQYFGQKLLINFGSKCVVNKLEQIISNDYLQLTPLSNITDEDKLKCYHIYSAYIGYDYTQDFDGIHSSALRWYDNEWNKRTENLLPISDYLRSKGYALPWMGVSVEQQIEYGWITLKD